MYVCSYAVTVSRLENIPLQKCCLCAADISASFMRAAYIIHVCSIHKNWLSATCMPRTCT